MKAKILVVDDWDKWRARLTKILKAEGYSVESASSYAEADRMLSGGPFDVAIVDSRLVDADESNIDGLKLLREIDERGEGTSLIVLTGYITRERAARFLGAREFDFVEKKQFEIGRFLAMIERAVAKARKRCLSACDNWGAGGYPSL